MLLKSGLPRSAPLHLTAAKSFMGHAEPAAGIVGITKLALILGQASSDPLLHLCTVNAYVASALTGAAQHGAAHRAAAPRQHAQGGSGVLLGGVSSFAFQGTNAHAVLAHQTAAGFALPTAAPAFLAAARVTAARFWVLPAAHPFISSGGVGRSKAGGATAIFECNLLAPRLALYAHHEVFGRVLFPGAGMLEAALAACSTLAEASAAPRLSVHSMAISNPIILPQPAGQPQAGAVLRCSIQPATGAFVLSHHSGRPSSRVENAAGRYALAAAVAVNTAALLEAQAVAVKQALLRRALRAAAGVGAGTATGSISVDPRLSTDAYLVPPPCMDACLHLGVAAPGCGAKVPVAVGAFLLAAAARAASTLPAELAGSTTAQHGVPSASSDVSSFALAASTGSAFASLADLETKVMRPKAGQQGAAAAALKPADFLYEVEWDRISHPAPPAGAHGTAKPAAEAGGQASFRLLGANAPGLTAPEAGVPLAAPQAAASAALALLQSAQAAAAGGVEAQLPDVLPSGAASRPAPSSLDTLLASGAVEGLLRVAATEQAASSYSLAATDALAAGPSSAVMTPLAEAPIKGILMTSRARGGAVAAPQLLRSGALLLAVELLQVRPMPRGSLANLVAQPFDAAAAALREQEVMVAVKAVGVNFRRVTLRCCFI